MRRPVAGVVGAPRCAGVLGGAAAFLHTPSLLQPFLRDSTAAATRTPRRSLSSSSSSPSSAFSGSPRCGSANRSAEKGFVGWLRQLYLDFQIYRDRQLDAVAAEEAQAAVEQRFYGDSDGASLSAAAAAATATTHGGQAGDTQARGRRSPLISRNPTLCPRSVLFVPGSKPRALAKIPTLPADCFILDLEDSVGAASKRRARENIQAFVEDLQREQRTQRAAQATAAAAGSGEVAAEAGDAYPRLIVRINSPDYDPATAILDLQLVGLLGPAIEGIALPKTTVRTHQLIKDYVYPYHQLWAFFESPLSVIQAPLICKQQVYQYAVMGYNDLSAELQLPMVTPSTLPGTTDGNSVSEAGKESLHTAMRLPLWQSTVQVLLAARAHHMFVIDAVFNDPTDKAGFRRSLQECRLLGLDGKTLIHPVQIEPTNAAYTPAEEEVAWAQRIVEAVARSGGDVTTVDGTMAEDLHQRQARHVLALHRSAELEKTLRKTEAPQGTADICVSKEAAEGTRATGAAGGDRSETGRQPRHTPSRHRHVS
ncbi:conserved hypothetical protein [Leishmania infantum JPCM5]|uniref:HpcH/HpaI_aldolase/citrate_lyase_family_-_putative n=2 Tax=Leishmania infantum TaxID=5671 RepID=A0A6L0XER3_LEIIN|nr:conserved hypothetical protein [Leishmania infantum JPCM5]CAC9491996.1 HpcH/HpaI_aldolase/citrate_lyase_family_-_putative [Leishmania infantum]CBZ08728.1 conserved hypothetical protein [Leishmania infantum JPCM5]SUZ42230.1 HpcH/HpaI_aldolase/citrate_lyase_family_-_putative [Leishmania infantum]|eukprot:XP_003392560.1 conserved hypothetical protein [Leishmania infantum JPCM5]